MYGQGSFHHHLDGLFELLPFTVHNVLRKNLRQNDTVLDIGCGPNSPVRHYKVSHSTGVDIFPRYIEAAKEAKTHDEFILSNCMELQFAPGSFDVVVALDCLEHLAKEDASNLIAKMRTWARKKVIISVPNGDTPGHIQDENIFQKHLSIYSYDALKKLDFRVYGIGIKKMPGYTSNGFAFYLSRYCSYPARLVTYYSPQLAFDLIGILDCTKTSE